MEPSRRHEPRVRTRRAGRVFDAWADVNSNGKVVGVFMSRADAAAAAHARSKRCVRGWNQWFDENGISDAAERARVMGDMGPYVARVRIAPRERR